ncbi:MAG: phage tail tape measure protein, partial [Lysobacteraceae bacterium]
MSSKAMKMSVIIGGAISGSFRSAMSSAQSGLKAIGSEIAKIERQQREMARQPDFFKAMSDGAIKARMEYARLAQNAEKLKSAQASLARVNERIEANRASRVEVGGQLRNAAVTFGAISAATLAPIRAATEFETTMLGVAKQLDGARDKAGNLTPEYFAMAKQVQRLGREIPIATNQIGDMVAAGLRMGVAKNEVIGFTRTAAMMADAFELPAGQLADDMGKIAGLFHIPIPRIGELADAINYLDDNSKSSGADIINVMRRIGGMAQTLKMPAKEAAALGSTFLSLGSSAEVAGTASNAVMRILGAATAQSKAVRSGMSSIGLDPAAVQASMAKDSTGTILRVLDKLNSLNSEQRMVASTRIFGAEYGDDIAKLAGGADEYRKQLALVRSEQQKGSMSREFSARLRTTAAQWQIAKNRASELGVTIGNALLPAVNGLLQAAGPMVERFADFSRRNPGVIRNIVGSAVALTGLRVAALGVRYAWLAIQGPFLKVGQLFARFRAMKAVAEAGGQVGRFGSALL